MVDGANAQIMDRATIEAVLRAYYLAEFLSNCIVDDKYKPPISMVTPLVLTGRGKTIAGQVKGDGIALMEAQLASFLAMWAGAELLVDPIESDLDGFRNNISAEVKRGRIKYPWIYGRKLYDEIAESSFHGSGHLNHADTLQLLGGLPQGVFQLGPYVCGPYGLVESRTWRNIPPTVEIPGHHCSELDCDRIHGVLLTTGDTGVSKARSLIGKKLSKVTGEPTDILDEVADFQASHIPTFSWSDSGSLPFFLFECLSEKDLRRLLVGLLAVSKGSLRGECEQLGLTIGNASNFASSVNDAQLLQIFLLARDSEIHECLNRLIWDDEIKIEPGETRVPRIVRRGFGSLNISMEGSRLGVRCKPPASFVPVRLRQLIYSCFPGTESKVDDRLKWPLRGYEGDSAAAKLTNALAAEAPVALVKRLIVGEERACTVALDKLGLPSGAFQSATDDEIAELITWHLGFDSLKRDVELHTLLEYLGSLRKLIGSLPAAFIDKTDISRIRQLSSDLFVSLEESLKRIICFIAWVTLRDHYAESYDLSYSKNEAKEYFVDWMASRNPSFTLEHFDNKLPLGEILSCFGTVAKAMKEAIANRESYRRDLSEWPRAMRDPSSPFRFPFQYRVPLLDLDNTAASFISDLVAKVPSSLQAAGVLDVRNGFLHHRDEVPDTARISSALEAIDARLAELIGNGLYPLIYTLESAESDSTGRRKVVLDSRGGPKVVLTRPSPIELAGMPPTSDPHIVVVRATLRDSGEPLRFDFQVDSEYTDRWRGFPRRPVKKGLPKFGQSGDGGS
ncbi:hypothetical protein AB0I60_16315 [Actinosynnema sp. NPDC050436]|uniref:hypothetical protein n=1 Tax=Actinosynnema sp. NPDC050436 TaxID=3155659 RepID=UPI0033E17FEC